MTTTYGKLTDIQTKETFDVVGFDYNYTNFTNNYINNFNINNYIINDYIKYINNYFGIYYLPKTNFNSKVLLVEFNKHDSFFVKVEKVVDHKDFTVVFTKYIKNNLEVIREVEIGKV
jgi:hypothetical protein